MTLGDDCRPKTSSTGCSRLVGALPTTDGVAFRVWAPVRRRVSVVFEGATSEQPLGRCDDGWFEGVVHGATAGSLYRYRLDDESTLFPDPASRFQPSGPHGPSEVIDPTRFAWTDRQWPGATPQGQVLYEMHIGTFTPEGTWESAQRQLPELADLGITAIEVMPVADFVGEFGWGYDGVDLFAPTRLYGRPDDFRRFVDAAHSTGMSVLLDVVYNHFGPDGNYAKAFSEAYFSTKHKTDWGEAINYDGSDAGPVREFFLANVEHWIAEYHLDGFRLDATQNIYDDSDPHILREISTRARRAAGERSVIVIGENEPQDDVLLRPAQEGGMGLDSLWNDDFHHSVMVALTGRREAYYRDYRGGPQELVSATKRGWLYQGQWYSWQKQNRGTPSRGLRPESFVHYIQNHDQIANSGRGLRCHQLTSPGRHRAATALLLLSPATPLLFQGQEFSSSSPFLFFADHKPDLAVLVHKGRGEFLAQFPSLADATMQEALSNPADRTTFERCKLDLAEREQHQSAYRLHRDLLRLRRQERAFSRPKPDGVDGAVLADEAFVLRFFDDETGDRLLLVNFGVDLLLAQAAEPLLAPPKGCYWEIQWTSEAVEYGGCACPSPPQEGPMTLPGHSAVVLRPTPLARSAKGGL